jgi:hypothetical protein
MFPVLDRSSWRIRPGFLAAIMLILVLGVDLDVVRGRGTASLTRSARLGPSELIEGRVNIGDEVRYRHDRRTYKVLATWPTTALIRRGDEVIYADSSDLIFE